MEVRDRVVMVTGAAHGIGRALAERLSREQPRALVLVDRDAAGVQSVAAGLPSAHAFVTDVGDPHAVSETLAQILAAHDGVDLLCSNAGVTTKGGVEVDNAEWDRLWRINVLSHVWWVRGLLPGWLARRSGGLIVTASAAGVLTEIGSAAYSVTKHAAVAFAEWLSVQHRRDGLYVGCLCPAGVATDFLDQADPVHQFLAMSALTPADVAEATWQALQSERFLILPHPEVAEFFRFKTEDYDRWLHNFSRIKQRLDRATQASGHRGAAGCLPDENSGKTS